MDKPAEFLPEATVREGLALSEKATPRPRRLIPADPDAKYTCHAANHYVSLANEVLARRKAMEDAPCSEDCAARICRQCHKPRGFHVKMGPHDFVPFDHSPSCWKSTLPDTAPGELEVWLCPVHRSLDDSRKLEPLDNCVACIRVQRDELTAENKRQAEELDGVKLQYRISQEGAAESEQRAMRFEYERDQQAEEIQRLREAANSVVDAWVLGKPVRLDNLRAALAPTPANSQSVSGAPSGRESNKMANETVGRRGKPYLDLLKIVAERVSKWPYWKLGEESARIPRRRFGKSCCDQHDDCEEVRDAH